MKKTKRQNKTESAPAAPKRWWRLWWIWAAAVAALFVVYQVYEPALNGAFVFDDRYLPFFDPNVSGKLWTFVGRLRPLLMFSFWVDYHRGNGADPYTFHSTNVFLHFVSSVLVSLIVLKLLEWANVAGKMRVALAIFAGGLFMLHPLQTESVAYVASRSEVLSAVFYFAAFAVFLWRGESMTPWQEVLRAIAILLLFGMAAGTKEDTLTLPVLMILTDLYWNRGLRKNAIMYGLMCAAALAGGIYVLNVLLHANTAGFGMRELSPLNYLFTECRVVASYLGKFVLPVGQNVDPDVAVSHGPLEHGAIIFLLAFIGLAVAAWIYRRRVPLAAFGFFTFLLLIAPTSSIIPIKDVSAEHRLYLPFLGLTLIACELLRRASFPQAVTIGGVVLAVFGAATYQRAQLWGDPVALWQDAVAKSPDKARPHFQLAYVNFERSNCPESAKQYEIASKLGPIDDELLTDWGLALDCEGKHAEALEKLHQAQAMNNTAHIHTQIAVVFAKQKRYEEARAELMTALQIESSNDLAIAYLGSVEEAEGNRDAARNAYLRALKQNPNNVLARAAMERLGK